MKENQLSLQGCFMGARIMCHEMCKIYHQRIFLLKCRDPQKQNSTGFRCWRQMKVGKYYLGIYDQATCMSGRAVLPLEVQNPVTEQGGRWTLGLSSTFPKDRGGGPGELCKCCYFLPSFIHKTTWRIRTHFMTGSTTHFQLHSNPWYSFAEGNIKWNKVIQIIETHVLFSR